MTPLIQQSCKTIAWGAFLGYACVLLIQWYDQEQNDLFLLYLSLMKKGPIVSDSF